MSEGIELDTEVDILRREGGFVDVEGMSPLVSGHRLIDDWIEIDGAPTDVDRHQGARHEWPARRGRPGRAVAHDGVSLAEGLI